MQKSLSVLIIATLTLTACSGWRDSRVNPSNWFGSSRSVKTETPPDPNAADALVPQQRQGTGLFSRPNIADSSIRIGQIDELRIDATPTGAIIYATGTAVRQGAYNARLVRVNSEENEKNGTMEFEFLVNYPSAQTLQGSERTRMVSDAVNVSRQDLEGIRLVRVVGQQNALESRRR
ncbi:MULTISPECIES: hypothetical protein [unclassified Ruegeria]|uniref:hypothetical protein n=1 Tax=unclassified Ruegeria TaxID=2625375 RepID=UPI0014881C26|nr:MULTISPECIES: hypothetical protein [unclassified Ruegeria]NOD75541.1 hypothetical protein [Ruegeria sp. HKCCD4332]NOD87523.1 hypothetical protein [Ruegeria sp. HKCCD4318]NOD91620.1 hypothetical protein [Ruegeria sp. HKCCD4884]NOE13078.1 hypothetical protein [Ruegeria sp. HKCCD4318-2]NOG08754.1 hypothetical protein [Ruegeria sp. HKCCD4315]